MANENELEIVVRVVDKAIQELQKIQGVVRSLGNEGQISGRKVQEEFKKQGEAIKVTGQKANDLQREWGRLTSSTEYFAQGLQSVRGMINSLTWGTIIGAVSALTMQLLQSLLTMKDFNAELKSASDNFVSLAGNLDPALQKTEEYRNAQFNLSIAEFAVARAMAARGIVEAQTNLGRLESISILDRLQASLRRMADPGLAEEFLGQTLLKNAMQARELQARIELLKVVLKTSIPDWNEYKGRIDETKKSQEAMGQAVRDNEIWFRNLNKTIMEQATEKLPPSTPQWSLDLEKGLSEEEKGRAIMERGRAEFRAREQEAMGRWALDEAQLRIQIEQNTNNEMLRMRQAQLQATAVILNQLGTLFDDSSKKSFQIQKALNIAQSLMNTFQAATRALAEGGPFAGPALAATITALGLAQVAKIASTNIGAAGGGGGIGGASGGGTPVSRGSLRGSADQSSGQKIEMSLHVSALDPARADWDAIMQQAGDAFGRYLNRGGRTGDVQIVFTRN